MQRGKGFKEEELSLQSVRQIHALAKQLRSDVLRMTQLAGDIPAGAAMSATELVATLMTSAEIETADPDNLKRDRIVVSHEYATPLYYAALGRLDFIDLDDAICLFRKAGSIFEGRPERWVPGVAWNCGNPGQGLSAACGLALAARWHGYRPNVFVLMSDEEQQRGDVTEARRLAKKYRLNNITVLIDANNVQMSGKTSEVMPQNLKYEYIADGWDVIEINGHDPAEIYQAVRRATQIQSTPVLVLANTAMGHGVSFMENQAEYYSRALNDVEYREAMQELGETDDLSDARDYRIAFGDFDIEVGTEEAAVAAIVAGDPVTYNAKTRLDNMSALAQALSDVADLNRTREQSSVAVFDCVHAHTAKLMSFAQKHHDRYLQCGQGLHAAATAAAAMSGEGLLALLTGMGVYDIAEVYNQLRLADINRAGLKIVATHVGLSAAGEGKAFHQLDYIGLIANLFGFHLIVPADPNQTDRAFRFMAAQPGNWVMALGAGETPVITGTNGRPLFAGSYRFEYGKIEEVRGGEGGVILATGQILPIAIEAWSILNREGAAPSLYHVPCPLTVDRAEEDPVLLRELRKGRVVTLEEHNVATGLGSRVSNVIARRGISCRLLTLGADRYALSGDIEELHRLMGLDVESIVAQCRKFLKR